MDFGGAAMGAQDAGFDFMSWYVLPNNLCHIIYEGGSTTLFFWRRLSFFLDIAIILQRHMILNMYHQF